LPETPFNPQSLVPCGDINVRLVFRHMMRMEISIFLGT
jgi:hypothetical protein